MLDRHRPFPADILQRQVEQLQGRVVSRERAAILDDLPQTHVHRFNRIGRVDDLANVLRIREERGHSLPVCAPRFANGRELRVPLPGKLRELKFGFFAGPGAIDFLQVGGYFLALLPADIVQRMPHQMYDAQLHLRFGEDRFDG